MVLISKITTDQQVSIPSVVSNLELRWFCYMIGLEKSRHPLNQSNSKQKPTAFGRLQFPTHFYFEFSLACCDIFLSCDWPLWLLWFLWHSSGRRSNWLHLDFLLVAVTEWLKEQSPLTENELEKLRINMDDFKVLDMFSRASSSSLFFLFEFSLANDSVNFCSDWSLKFRWFWFFHIRWKPKPTFLKHIPYLNDCRYTWTAVWEMIMRAIFAVMNTT